MAHPGLVCREFLQSNGVKSVAHHRDLTNPLILLYILVHNITGMEVADKRATGNYPGVWKFLI